MSVFKSLDGNELILSCKCGCDEGIRVKAEADSDDGSIWYQTYLSGNWYKEQGHFLKKIKKIWAIIRNKDFYYSEIMLDEQDWKAYKEWINEH